MPAHPDRVTLRYLEKMAARPIPIDKGYLRQIAQEMADKTIAELKRLNPRRTSWQYKALSAYNSQRG